MEDEAPDITKLKEGEDYEIHEMNREPQLPEIEACKSHIDEIIQDFQPHGIVYLGEVAKSYKTNLPNLSLYHPAYIARLEYKLLTVNKQSRKLELFIERLADANPTL